VVWIFPAFPRDVLPVAAARVLRSGGGGGGRVRQYGVAETAGGEGAGG
jgi:hypothetical protein